MNEFKGVSAEGLMLLAENRFNDSKSFYEENKERLKRLTTEQMYALIRDLTGTLTKIDDLMVTIPSKMVSRIRRDTRYTNDKSLYRENMWVMFMRDKATYNHHQPCMWFEFTPQHYNFGVGLFWVNSRAAAEFRRLLDEEPSEFKKALKKVKKAGASPKIEYYKKDRSEGKDKALKDFYNAKNFYFISENKPVDGLIDGSCEEELLNAIKNFASMYNYLMKVTMKLIDNNIQGEKNNG